VILSLFEPCVNIIEILGEVRYIGGVGLAQLWCYTLVWNKRFGPGGSTRQLHHFSLKQG